MRELKGLDLFRELVKKKGEGEEVANLNDLSTPLPYRAEIVVDDDQTGVFAFPDKHVMYRLGDSLVMGGYAGSIRAVREVDLPTEKPRPFQGLTEDL